VKKEISILKMLDHPHIVKLHEVFDSRKKSYLVMEMCAGGELFDRIVQAKRFTETEAAIFMQQIIRGVFYMHEHGFCHRDLKPENFLFTDRGPLQLGHLKIIDLGLACRFEPGKMLTERVGTSYYVAPQVLNKSYDEQCDMWSLGCVLYLMLSGVMPFHGRTQSAVLRKVKQGQVAFGLRYWSSVSKEAKSLTRKLLEMDPKIRFTAEQALADEWIQRETPRASDVSLGTEFIDRLHSYQQQHLLKKAALSIIAGLIEEEYEKPLRDKFTSLDQNDDGTVSVNELLRGLETAGRKHASVDAEQLMKAADSDGSGNIDYTEFLAATMDKSLYLTESYCRAAFSMFDLNNDGKISSEELNSVLRITSDENNVKQLTPVSIVQEVDLDGDSYIDFSEFMQMMQQSPVDWI
jgi:calcium-dependent protein kinase